MSLLALVTAATASTIAACPLPFDAVPDEASARAIARVVIASAPAKMLSEHSGRYDLSVSFVHERRSWLVYEKRLPDERGMHSLGGGGLGMEIDACAGTVSDIHVQR